MGRERAVIGRWLHRSPAAWWRVATGVMCLLLAGTLSAAELLAPDPPPPEGICGNCVPGEEP